MSGQAISGEEILSDSKPFNPAPTPVLLALLSAFLFGIATPFSKWLLDAFSPFQLAGLLYLGAAIASIPPALKSQERIIPPSGDYKNRNRLIGAVVFGGVLGPLLLLFGLSKADSTAVSLWLNMELAATAILGVMIFNEHLGKLSWVGIFIASLASVLISFEPGVTANWAGVLLLFACFCWGIDNHLTAQIDTLSPSQSTFWKGLVAGSMNLAIGIILQPFQFNVLLIALALLLGALSYGLSIVLYIRASHSLGATRSQVLFSTAPFFGVLMSVVFLGESFTSGYALAAALFGVAIGLQLVGGHVHPHRHTAMTHTHAHRHDDGHHNHTHENLPKFGHVHRHTHEELEHSHPHMPDIHHKHEH